MKYTNEYSRRERELGRENYRERERSPHYYREGEFYPEKDRDKEMYYGRGRNMDNYRERERTDYIDNYKRRDDERYIREMERRNDMERYNRNRIEGRREYVPKYMEQNIRPRPTERERRDEDYNKYYKRRKSRSRSYSRSRSRDRPKVRKERRRDSRSHSSHRNDIIDQAIKDGIRQIEEAESFDRTVLMYSFPNEVNEKKIFNFFAGFGVLPIIDIKLLRDPRTGRSKNCCYVEFDSKDMARQAISLNGQIICGQPCQIVSSQAEKNRQALASRLKREQGKERNNPGLMNNIVKYSKANEQIDLNDAPMKIYVGGLTENLSNITEDDLCNIFGFGEIDSIELHKDPITGRSKGYAFIQFHRGSKAREVIQAMNGFVYQGKQLKVGEANENNTVIKGKMFLAKQQQEQQKQIQQQMQQQANEQKNENEIEFKPENIQDQPE